MLQEQADAMGIVFQNNKGQITSFENLNSALFTLMEDRYKGSMEMQSKTFKGMISNAKDMMGNIGRTVGAPIFEAFKDSLEGLLETANSLMESGKLDEWANNVAGAIEDMRSKVDMAVGVYKALKSNLDVIAPIITSIGLAIFAVKIPAIVAWTLATKAQIVTQWALIAPMIATMAPIIAVGLAIGALIYIWKNYGGAIKEYAVGAWNSVQTQFNQIISFVKGINLWEVGANIIRGLVNGMTSMLDSAMETARNIGSGIAGTLKSFFGIQSPSKLMFQYGGFIGEGLDMGMQSKTQGLKATSQGMAEATDKQFTNTTTNSSSSYAPIVNITVNGSGGGARETANMVRKEVKNVLDAQNRKMMLRLGV